LFQGEPVFLDLELYRPPAGTGRAGFFNRRTKIILAAVGVGAGGNVRIELYPEWRLGSERAIIEKLLGRLEELSSVVEGRNKRVLVGYGILTTDLPIIAAKSRAYRLRGAESTLYRRFIVLDLFQYALSKYRGEGLPSMAWLAGQVLGEGNTKRSGHIVHELYENGSYREIEEYQYEELRLLARVYEALAREWWGPEG